MDAFFIYICEHIHHAPWILCVLLLSTGIGIPISEDLLLLSGGALASCCMPEHALEVYLWLFWGSYAAASITYAIGRLLGPKLFEVPAIQRVITKERIDLLGAYYARFGIFTFIIGRFCPGGIRNALFASSGLTKMPYYLFLLRDGLACLISTLVLFTLGYQFGANLDVIAHYLNRYTELFLLFLSLAFIFIFLYIRYVKRK